jgi:hypothetical protein
VPRKFPFLCEITLADTPFHTRLASESTEAFHAFSIYRDLGLQRSLDEVSRRLDAEKRGTGIRLVSAKEVRTKHRKSGKIGLWSRKYRWVERAAAWDHIVDQRLREKQLDEIERMAKRQAQGGSSSIASAYGPGRGIRRRTQGSEPRPNARER